MSRGQQPESGQVRLLFEMTREDNPRLYDDLIRFNKGTKRVNRLRYLAHEGLLAQGWAMVPAAPMPTQSADAPSRAAMPINQAVAARVVQVFDLPEEVGEHRVGEALHR